MLSLEEELQLRHESLPGRSLADMEIGSVHQFVRRQARRTPNRPALQGADSNVLCYQELDLISDLMAEDLRHRLSDISPHPIDTGLAVDSAVVVGIMLQRSPAVVVAILSCWKAGYAIVLLDPSQPISRNGYIIEDCNCALLLVDESWTGGIGNEIAWKFAFDALSGRVKTSDDATQSDRGSEIDLSKDLFRPAWIRVTSGSTGRPKCALHSHATFGASIASYARRIRGSKTLLFFNPISSASGNLIWSFLTNGGCVCIPSQSKMTSDLAGCINRYGIDDLCITPSALSLTTPDQVPTLKTVSLVGEATPRSLGEAWSQHVSLLIGYGATEMNSHSLPFHDEP
jgi:non-ribosomal peptide synthetase component F